MGGGGQQPMPSTFTTQSGTDGRQADVDDDTDGNLDGYDGVLSGVGICGNRWKLFAARFPEVRMVERKNLC